MKRLLSITLAVLMLLTTLAACGKTGSSDGLQSPKALADIAANGYPKMEEISYSFRDTVRYGKPVAAFDYTNNSDYTIIRLELYFKMKDGVTSEQLQLTDIVSDERITDEEIREMEPHVYDWIVCDPGETAQNAVCSMVYNTEPTNTAQCALMDLVSANIHFIGGDNKEHSVAYSAENGGYSLSEKTNDLFVWLDNDYTAQIPKPQTRIANAEMYNENFYAKVYDITYDAFLAYVDACEENGFQNQYPNEDIDYSYSGTNSDEYEIYIRYIDYLHCMEIELTKEEH